MKRTNPHTITYCWRGDWERRKTYAFPSKEDAWNFVLGCIRKQKKSFDRLIDENHKETYIDFDNVKKVLLSTGKVIIVYGEVKSWFETWLYMDVSKELEWPSFL